MYLHADDINDVYFWVDGDDPTKELSPHFDYIDDALHWKDAKLYIDNHVHLL